MSENKTYDSIMNGLNEAIEDTKSEMPMLKRNRRTLESMAEALKISSDPSTSGYSSKEN